MIRDILLLGDERLYEASAPVTAEDLPLLPGWVCDLHDTLLDYRAKHGAGRAVAAPQIGVRRRLIYMLLDRPYVLVNPRLTFPDEETYELLDDCMSFPGLAVRVKRHRRCVLDYTDEQGCPQRSWRATSPSWCSTNTTTWTASLPPCAPWTAGAFT